MDAVLDRIQVLKDELAELWKALDKADDIHYSLFYSIKSKINTKNKELEKLVNLVESKSNT